MLERSYIKAKSDEVQIIGSREPCLVIVSAGLTLAGLAEFAYGNGGIEFFIAFVDTGKSD